jgi:pyrroloquinoline quinone biosynthesis protein B
MTVKIRVLGSAAGGGFPQWNCNCRNCAGVRAGTLKARPRTQSSIAVAGHAGGWALVNASPDILAQLQANPILQPARAARDTALAGIVLVDGQIDHTTGLFMLREATRPWPVWCTDSTYADLTRGNPILQVLAHYCGVERQRIDLNGAPFAVEGVAGVTWRALPVASKPAPYSPNREAPVPGDNVALVISDEVTGRSLLYAPGLGAIEDPVWRAMQSAACVLVDGTFWTDEEMIGLGLSRKRARDIGHLAQSGPGGMLEWLARLPAATRKVLIHVNNTNPILDEESAERGELTRRGIEVAWDGMEITL